MREYFTLTVVLMLCLSTYGCSNTKNRKIDEALEKRQEEKHSLKEQIKKDKTKPIIKYKLDSITMDASQNVDYDRIQMGLSAEDNLDGNITDKIKKENSNVVEHQEGDYEIVYSVKDRAGNKTTYSLPLTITSKYDPTEKNRLLSASKACKTFMDSTRLTDLFISNIISTSTGNMVLLSYDGTDEQGEFVDGRIIYYSEDGTFENLPEYSSYPSEFNENSEYSEDDIDDFIKYYHLYE